MVIKIRNRSINFPTWLFWSGLVVIGLLIVIFNDAFGHSEGFIIFGLTYFAFLGFTIIGSIFFQIRRVISLKRDKAKMEMLHLKSQVNPHFFFNTLNNLYGLVEKNPKEAQELILQLSDLMRYSIYEGQKEWVYLSDEVAYLQNYLTLQKNRYHKKVVVNFSVKIESDEYQIMPLMLIILVENAFKHGVEKLRKGAYVNMDLLASDSRIDFVITNNFDLEEMENKSAGIGISNLKRRLEIGYKKDFDLSIERKDETFHAQLSLYKI